MIMIAIKKKIEKMLIIMTEIDNNDYDKDTQSWDSSFAKSIIYEYQTWHSL